MVSLATPRIRPFARDEYYRMGELSFFEGQRVQLIEGEIIQISPQKNPHAVGIGKVQYALLNIFPPERFWIRVQLPLVLSNVSEPQPDLAVVEGKPGDFHEHPSTALLVVEDYWIVNVSERQVEVFRRPVADASAVQGFRYDDQPVLKPGETLTPVAAPGHVIAVDELLP
jgi:Uma2 family endonuclease